MSKTFRILFVCTGNICRSPMAEGILKKYLKDLDIVVEVRSAGIIAGHGRVAAEKSIQTARERGVDISHHRTHPVNRDILSKMDLILVMAKEHYQFIKNYFQETSEKIYYLMEFGRDESPPFFDIDDPIGLSIVEYQQCYTEMELEILRILPIIEMKALEKTGKMKKN